jgi:hypothetical protein
MKPTQGRQFLQGGDEIDERAAPAIEPPDDDEIDLPSAGGATVPLDADGSLRRSRLPRLWKRYASLCVRTRLGAARGPKQEDGSIDAAFVLIGQDGLVPPM